jgi:ABC-type Fe3+-hydroxamate transport system substrate-binding protein
MVYRLRALYNQVTTEVAQQTRLRVFCPIWRKPWMTFNADTYADNMLWCCGGENILRLRADRYFTVTLEEVAALAPEVVVLPSEPYPFTTKHYVHLKPLADTPASRAGHLYCVDGMALCWYGPRIADGLEQFSRLFAYVRATVD